MSKIDAMRKEFDAHFSSDPAVALVVGWGHFYLNSGERSENVVIGFYPQSQFDEIAHGIQEMFGMKIVFFTIPDYRERFEGKVIDHTRDRGFFLRAP
ncbi:MAG: hypothetical protein GC182_15970 [Rhodopseudomonas sp.]|nr:hypothetical protein [Rhodopseudomonas sp.]